MSEPTFTVILRRPAGYDQDYAYYAAFITGTDDVQTAIRMARRELHAADAGANPALDPGDYPVVLVACKHIDIVAWGWQL